MNLKIFLVKIKKPAFIHVFELLLFSSKFKTLFFLSIERTPNLLLGFIVLTRPIFFDFLKSFKVLFKFILDNPSQ